MNKKFLSAILFGALMVTSTGTFVSCKDYDDEIDQINTELTGVKSQIAALQAKVDAGKYITGVATTADGITLTLSDGTSYTVTNGKNGETGAAGQAGDKIEINADGFFVLNGETTTWKAVTADQLGQAVKIKTPTIAEDGTWVFYNEKGEAQSTTIKAAPVTAVQNADKSWTLTVYAADGTSQKIDVPSAASLLTDLIVLKSDANIPYYTYAFTYKGANKPKVADWKGPRALPAKNGNLVAAIDGGIEVQINPTTVDATGIEFSLVDSKNNYPSGVTLTVTEDKSLVSRAAYGNGKYVLTMEDVYFNYDASTAYNGFVNQFKATDPENKCYAITAGGDVRSTYAVTVKSTTTNKLLESVGIKDGDNDPVYYDVAKNVTSDNDDNEAIYGSLQQALYQDVNLGSWYSVVPDESAATYDMYISVASDYVTLYGIELVNESDNWKFRITKTPDNITRATFPLTIETVDKNGTYKKTTIWVSQSDKLTNGYTYEAISYELKNKAKNENRFAISLAELKNSLGADNLALWNTKVDLTKTTITVYDPIAKTYMVEDMGINGTTNAVVGITPMISKTNADNSSNTNVISDSNYILFLIDNAAAGTGTGKWVLGRQYEATITFNTEDGNTLTTAKVPFTLTIPAITTVFELDKNFVVNGEAIAYMYEEDWKKVNTTVGASTFKLNRVFSKFDTKGHYTVALDNSAKIGETNLTSAQLAAMATAENNTTATTYITLANELSDGTNLVSDATGLQKGYGQSLKLSIGGKFAGTWSYGDEKFNFTMKVLSPIYEGGVKAKSGESVVIPATKLDGYKFGNNDIVGNTYNTAVKYNVLPDLAAATPDWKRVELAQVIAQSSNTNVFTLADTTDGWATPKNATDKKDDKGNVIGVNEGYFTLNAQNVPTTTATNSIKVQVKDIWGYKKTSTINVTITVE